MRLPITPTMSAINVMHKYSTIITIMQYYYIMAQQGRRTFRCYVRLTRPVADRIHDVLDSEYDLVQVCDVDADQVDPALLLHK